MVKKLALIAFLLIFISACVPFDLIGPGNSSNGSSSDGNSSNPNVQATVAAILTEQPELHPSATSFQPQPNFNPTAKPTDTPIPTVKPSAPTATKTSSSAPSFINVTLVQDGSKPGDANVFWDATGAFPYGFKVLWSSTNSKPAFPGDSNVLINDAGARSTTIHAQAGTTFFFRVCRYTDGICDTYSNSYSFQLAELISPTSTTGNSITIQNVEAVGTGQAKVTWSADGSFSKGFKVVWSDSTTAPKYPDNSAVFAGADARSATITGTPGTKYFIRVCKYNGSGCDFYSSKFTYTFPSAPAPTEPVTITIKGMSDKVTGSAYIEWSVTGSFPIGFKIAWSATNPEPVYPPDSGGLWTYISDGNARSAVVDGTPGTTYYFRICQYLGGACGVYSNSYTFTFEAAPEPTVDTSTIVLDSVVASADPTIATLTWTASGSFPNGFKIIWSSTINPPTYPDGMDGYNYISDPSATTGDTLALAPGTFYYVRVCKYDVVTAFVNNLGFFLFSPLNTGSITTCTIYSNVLEYTVPTP
jgi:hypothetical protein